MAKVLHASYSGYFPFCIEESDAVGNPNGFFPISMELEDIMEVYWKINFFSGTGPEGEINQTRIEYIRPGRSNLVPQKETEIVCANNGVLAVTPITGEIILRFCCDSENMGLSPAESFKGVRKSGELYYPSIYILAVSPSGDAEGVSSKFIDPAFIQTGQITFFGYPLPTYSDQPIPPRTGYTGTIEASSYWPYEED